MPVSPDQLTADVDFLTSQPDWQDEQTRGDYIRNLAVNSRSNVEPEEHRAVIGKLWELADDRSLARKGAEFVGTAVEEVAKSAVAMPVAAGMALTDAVGMTDTGSGTRLVEGVKNLVDQTGQVVKQAMPGKSKQAERDELLGFLKQDLDEGAVPDELENWLAGAYDGQDLPEPLQPWVDGLSRGIAKKAVAADFSGDVPPEKVNAWLTTDRNPLFSDSDDGTPGPRELLADYVATRDPKSWEAFQSRVTETDQQYQTRVRRALTEQQFQADVKGVGGFTGEMIGRAADMQTSPIDLATAVLPVLRGSKALMAARAGKAGLAKDLTLGAAKEGVQEGVTEKLTDARASAMDVAEAAAMGAIGGGALEGGMAGAGALTRQLSRPVTSPTVEGDLPGTPVSVPESERSPGMTGLEEDTGDLTLDDVADLEAAPADARFMPPPDLTAGLTDLGTVEGDLLTDARFRPPPQAQAQTPAANVDLSAGTNLARATPAELAPLGTDQDVAAAEARLAAAQDGREQRLAQADLVAARSGVGPVAQAVNSARRAAVDLAIANREPVAAEAMDIYARTPINALDAAGNIQMQGMPAGYVQRGDQFVFEEAAAPTGNESLSVQDEAQTAQADAVIAQQAQARGLRPPTPGTVSRQGSALPFEEIVGMAAAAIRSGVTNFSAWATAMLRRFGQAISQYLADAWQAAVKNSQVGARANLNPNARLSARSPQIKADGTVEGMITSAVDVLYGDSQALPKPAKKVSNDVVAKNLQEQAFEQWGDRILTSDTITPAEEQVLVRNGVQEFVAAFNASGKTAADWYTTNIASAMAVAEVLHPELQSDEAAAAVRVNGKPIFRTAADAKLALYLPMAITSQNLNVNQNTTYAEEQFNIFKRTGRFDPTRLYGEKAKSISANLELANLAIQELGWDKLGTILETDYTVKEISDLVSALTGRKIKIAGRMSDVVQGAAMFGPKIGQGFLQNLMGRYFPVTIDLWMRRTWGRWTGDVLGDGITGDRLARMIDAARASGLVLPRVLTTSRPVYRAVYRTTKTGKQVPTGKQIRTMSEEFLDRLEEQTDLKETIFDFSKEVVALWQRNYKALQAGLTAKQFADLTQGRATMEKVAGDALRAEERLDQRYEALTVKPKGKGAKDTWKQAERIKAGRTQKLITEDWKTYSLKKPEWALAANVIRTQLKPIDAPSDQDRAVISRVVNNIRVALAEIGINVSNADIQAVLWYPEKDLWAKLRGEEESDLKLSYEDEFLRLANERGLTGPATEAAARVRAARSGGQSDTRTEGGAAAQNERPGASPQEAGTPPGLKNFTVVGKTNAGSTVLYAELVGMADRAVQAGITFAQWAADMVSQLGAGVRKFLEDAWQAATAAANRAAKAPVTFGQRPLDRRARAGEGGFTGGSPLGQDGPPNLAETRSRFARPDAAERLKEVRADATVRQQAEAWLDSLSMEQAVAAMEAGRLPASMTMDVAQQAAGLILQRTTAALRTGTEVQQMQSRALGHRMSRVWQGWLSQEASRSLRQRGVVNAELVPYAPILAAEGLLIDRADAVVGKRFEGGAEGAAAKVGEVSRKAGEQASADLAADLDQAQGRITAKDSPMLVRLLNTLRKKMAPGMTWADIFMELPSTQRERQRAIYQRLMLDERLRGLTADERLKLTNELDKAWQRKRRKVFNRELQRVGVLGEKGLTDRVKIQKAMPKLLRLINLGMMNSEMFREAIAPQYGLRMISSAEAVGLRKLAEEAWALPEGVLRNRKLAEMLDSIQRATGGSVAEILNSYWVAAVLSGLRTMFDTFMAVTTGFGTALTQQGMLLARGKGRAAWQAHGQWWRGLGQGLDESFGILWNGDYRFQKRFNEDLRRAMDGESTFRPVPLGEALWRQGGLWKFPAAVMLWTGRLMAAADHINNTATTHGAMAVARALNPELYAGKAGFTPQERAAAQAQALNEVTGGTSPTTADERRTVKARTREILHGLLKPETRTEANFIGDESAYQNDPIGILGGLYQMFNAGLGLGERLTLAAAQRIDGQGPGAGFARGAMAFAAGALRSATGTKFARFGANFGNHIWSFVPGSYLMSRGGQALGNLERTRSQNDLLLGRNVIGLALGASTFALLGDKDDEEDGLHLEGSWSGLTIEEKAQRRSAGFEPLTMWWRDGDKIQRLSYKSWPTAGIFAGVGAYADERRFQPARAASRGWAGHLLHAAGAGALMIKDVNALRSLAELFGASASSSDPEADLFKRMGRIPTNFVGGFVPTGVKDLDALRDPRSYKAEGVWEELARSVPGLRQTVNGGRPSITLLGDPIYFDRKPWSRAFTSAESPEPYRVLGVLNSRGLSVPAASTERYVWHNGSKVQIKSLGREAEYKYVKAVGKGYKEWLATEGRDLLSQPPEAAARQIRLQSERIKLTATLQAFGPD